MKKEAWLVPTLHSRHRRVGKESGYQEVKPSSCPAQGPGALTLSPSGAGRSLPPFYYLQREGRSLEAG